MRVIIAALASEDGNVDVVLRTAADGFADNCIGAPSRRKMMTLAGTSLSRTRSATPSLRSGALPNLRSRHRDAGRHSPRILAALVHARSTGATPRARQGLANMADWTGFHQGRPDAELWLDLLPAEFLTPLEGCRTAFSVATREPPRRQASLGRRSATSSLRLKTSRWPGSIAVVCRATGRRRSTGGQVVRPGVTRQIARDLDCLRWLASIAARSRSGAAFRCSDP
jgi:hypothetical protein